MAFKLINTGMARSATLCFAQFFKKQGINATHQGISGICGSEHKLFPYDLDNWPRNVINYLSNNKKFQYFLKKDMPTVESNWTTGWILYPIHKTYPEIQFSIIIRDIEQQANSLRVYRKRGAERRGNKYIDDPNFFANKWLDYYRFVLEHLKRIKSEVFILHFHKYIAGEYNTFLRSLFDIPATPENDREMNRIIFEKKPNCNKQPYQIKEISKELKFQAKDLIKRLEDNAK